VKDAGLVTDPSSASSVIYNATAGQFFAAIQWHGLYSSTDGANWNRLNSQPGGLSPSACPPSPNTPGCPLYRGEFAVVPGRNEMYFWYVTATAPTSASGRPDGGATWTQLNDAGIPTAAISWAVVERSRASTTWNWLRFPMDKRQTSMRGGEPVQVPNYDCLA
jgi:hypothetical protein